MDAALMATVFLGTAMISERYLLISAYNQGRPARHVYDRAAR